MHEELLVVSSEISGRFLFFFDFIDPAEVWHVLNSLSHSDDGHVL